MKSSKQRTRIVYAPLVLSSSISHDAALTQVYNADEAQYEPDRSLTPLVLTPVVMAVAGDGSVGVKDAGGVNQPVCYNAHLGGMRWLVNGKDITTLPEWAGLYQIDTSTTDTRGTIAIRRNIPQGMRVELCFEATVPDTRTGLNVKVPQCRRVLTTIDKAEDHYALAFGHGASVGYNPVRDRLALYEYEVANGLAVEDAATRAQYTDNDCYLREIPITVFRGPEPMTSGFALRLSKMVDGTWQEMTPGECELLAITSTGLQFDLRPVDSGEYLVELMVNGVMRTRGQLSIFRYEPAAEAEILNSTSINAADTERRSSVVMKHGTQVISHPARLYNIRWMSDTSVPGRQEMAHNVGETGYINLQQSGFFDPTSEGWIDIYVNHTPKGAHAMAYDDSGSQLTDKDGNNYIFQTL